EVEARVKAIAQRQQQLRDCLAQQRQRLGALYAMTPTSAETLQEMLTQVQHLREIFLETPDQDEVHGLVVQLQRIAEDVATWEQGEVPPERLSQVLAQQSADQLAGLLGLLSGEEGDPGEGVEEGRPGESDEPEKSDEIEPVWDLAAVYQALVQERVAAAERRSEDWIKPRRPLRDVIARANAAECERLAHELDGAPGYLAQAHQEEIAAMREALAQRRAALDAEARAARVQRWREQFPAADAVARLDKHRTEQLLQALREPPDPLTAAEQAALEPIGNALHAHYDQMSLDEILARIRRLSQVRQRELYGMLAAELG
ncbi:MAG: hypothetical protein GVY22_08560, partial [Gammaproteobacteria bacterium]|nr:hypothetical protein [Gammaproteobacteria bacterium]